MSYDLAVWEGSQPENDQAALDTFIQLAERYLESPLETGAPLEPPTPRIAAYAQALLRRYPDITADADNDSPWSVAPLIGEASGPIMHFPIVWSRCEDVSAWAAHVAHDHGLVCYDPQLEKLRP